MSRPTLVFIKAHYIDGRIVHYFGDEMPPRLFAQEVINRLLDDGVLAEYGREQSTVVIPALFCL